ncbi:MAG: serine/threonine protein kinase [Planctomycetales bacterium]|nr:serine/threonine protein kinase [Planctomycetales bacterium]
MRCNDESLQCLLQADDRSDEFRRATRHVDECSYCQQRLERLAADAAMWREVKDTLVSGAMGQDGHSASPRVWLGSAAAWNESMARQLLDPPSHPELLGRLGRYDVERLIGSGGMGIVLKGFDGELSRPVAIKILAPHLAGNGAARLRFAREARAAAAVVHPHVVAIHNVETNGASPFLVMQFVGGESLQQRLDREGALDVCAILRIAMQTADGLAAAHSQGLVHRDVKPSNILLDLGVEHAMLTDFGLARASDDASLTHTGHHPGTPQYMSPEQARGVAIDARSDLFSLGSVIYAMCTGRPPFRADTSYGILRQITDSRPTAIRELNPRIPEWLEAIVARLHEKCPEHRIQTAEQLRSLLAQCLAHVQQPLVCQLPRELRKQPAVRRRGWWLAAGGVVAATLLATQFRDAGHWGSAPASASRSASRSAIGSTTTAATDSSLDWNSSHEALESFRTEWEEFEFRAQQLWDESSISSQD